MDSSRVLSSPVAQPLCLIGSIGRPHGPPKREVQYTRPGVKVFISAGVIPPILCKVPVLTYTNMQKDNQRQFRRNTFVSRTFTMARLCLNHAAFYGWSGGGVRWGVASTGSAQWYSHTVMVGSDKLIQHSQAKPRHLTVHLDNKIA